MTALWEPAGGTTKLEVVVKNAAPEPLGGQGLLEGAISMSTGTCKDAPQDVDGVWLHPQLLIVRLC